LFVPYTHPPHAPQDDAKVGMNWKLITPEEQAAEWRVEIPGESAACCNPVPADAGATIYDKDDAPR
jgi:hypothetical protein